MAFDTTCSSRLLGPRLRVFDVRDSRLELVAATGVAEPDDVAVVLGQRINPLPVG